MEDTLYKIAAGQGPFALLFIWLLFYVLKENAKREANYQTLLKSLSDSFDSLKNNFCEFKDDIDKIIRK